MAAGTTLYPKRRPKRSAVRDRPRHACYDKAKVGPDTPRPTRATRHARIARPLGGASAGRGNPSRDDRGEESMLKIKRIDHIAICVGDLDEAGARWQALLGLTAKTGEAGVPGARTSGAATREWVESQKTEAMFLPVGDTSLELVTPRGNEGLQRFLEKRGAGLHHIALEVEGLDEALAFLTALGVPLIDTVPRTGARGHRVAFVHPKATGGVLVELVEVPPQGA
jgi:methylmalonyl-CoA/ethylmalonyl-CoA epimerase